MKVNMTLDTLVRTLSKPYLAKSEIRAILKEYTDSVIEKYLPEEKELEAEDDLMAKGFNSCRAKFLKNYQLKDK